jgi:hypothetical protein
MRVEESADAVSVLCSEREFAEGSASETAEELRETERERPARKRRRVVIAVIFGFHEASETEVAEAPRGRLFPRPVRSVGASTPEVLAQELATYASSRDVTRSDVMRVLWSEFLGAVKRDGPGDSWAKRIEKRVDEVCAARANGHPLSYALLRRGVRR